MILKERIKKGELSKELLIRYINERIKKKQYFLKICFYANTERPSVWLETYPEGRFNIELEGFVGKNIFKATMITEDDINSSYEIDKDSIDWETIEKEVKNKIHTISQ